MRPDFKKVLCERPRAGGRYDYHAYRRRPNSGDLEDLPHTQSMRRPYLERWGDCKEFTDLIGPLRRFFESRVGQRYNDVWSELCVHLSGGSTIEEHLKGHARQFCETETVLIDGKVYMDFASWRAYREPCDGELYVDPRDGIIYRAPPRVRARYSPTLRYGRRTFVEVDGILHHHDEDDYFYRKGSLFHKKPDNTKFAWKIINEANEIEAVRFNGIWYWVEFASVPVPETRRTTAPNGEVVESQVIFGHEDFITRATVNVGRYRSGKHQMSKRDLRRYGLTNDYMGD